MARSRPFRVLHVTRLPSTVVAFLLPFLRAHRARGEHVFVACNEGPEADEIRGEGFTVCPYKLDRSLSPLNLIHAYRQLVQIIRNNGIDWVVVHTPIASGVGRLAAWRAGVSGTVYMAHGLPCGPQLPRLAWLAWYSVEYALGHLTNGIITINQYDYDLARTRLARRPDRVYRIGGVGVDTQRLDHLVRSVDRSALLRKLEIDPEQAIVLMLARTVPEKGVREFLEAARRLVEKGARAAFVLAGAGPLDAEITEFIQRHGLPGGLYFLGWRRDAHELVATCDVYVLPSYYPEGLPASILEAMACAKPVIATRTRGCEDAVEPDSTGILVPPRNIAALESAVRMLIKDPELARRLGQAGRRRIDEGFRSDQTVAAFFRAFDEITRRQ